jgi:hypothetical protein
MQLSGTDHMMDGDNDPIAATGMWCGNNYGGRIVVNSMETVDMLCVLVDL